MKILIGVALLSLFYGLWASWVFFIGDFTRPEFLLRFGIATVLYFLTATIWAYQRNRAAG